MLIRKIELQNFMCHDHATLTLPPTGITLISGDNGTGKSSFAEGVASLWNKSLRKKKSRKTRGFRKGQAGSARVTTADGLVATRMSTKSGTLKLDFARGGATPANYATATKAQEALETEIGTYDLWRRACVFSSADASGFTSATDGERRTLLEELLDLEQFALAHDIAKTKLKALKAEFESLQSSLAMTEQRRDMLASRIEAVEKDLASNPEPELPDALDPEVESRLVTVKAEIEALETKRREAGKHEELIRLSRVAVGKREALREPEPPADADVDGLRAEWTRLDALVAGLEKDLMEATAEVQQAELNALRESGKVAPLEEKLKQLSAGNCPVCEQTIPQSLRDDVAAVALHAKHEADEAAREAAEVKGDALEQEIEIDEQLRELRKKRDEVKTRGTKATQAKQFYDRDLETYRTRLAAFTKDAEDANASLAEHDVQVFTPNDDATLTALKFEADKLEATVNRHKRERAVFLSAQSTWQVNDQRWRETLKQLRSEHTDAEADAKVHVEASLNCSHKMQVAEAGVEMLAPKGVRAHILQRALTAIESICNRWLREFHDTLLVSLSPYSESAKGKTTIAIALKICERDEGDEYEDLSGGERRRLDLAMVLALAEVARLAQGVEDWGTLFLDEILDAVDLSGADRVCAAIQRLSADRSVVVITHNPDIRTRLHPVQEIALG